jgi:hypothetical protein
MLDENVKISLRNMIATVIFIGGMVYGWQVIIGGIQTQQAILADKLADDRAAARDYRVENTRRLERMEVNQTKLMMALGVKPEIE